MPPDADGCPPDDGVPPDEEGCPPEGDGCPLDVDGLPDEPDGDELPLGSDEGICGDGIETLGAAQPAVTSAAATTPIHAKL